MSTSIRLPGGGKEMIPSDRELDTEFMAGLSIEILEVLLKANDNLDPEVSKKYLDKIDAHKARKARIKAQLQSFRKR